MGKVKRSRQKFHLERAKSMNDLTTIDMSASTSLLPRYENLGSSQLTSFKISDNLFEGIEIPINLNQSLPDDCKSIVSTKSTFKDYNLTKKQKRNLRHEAFIRKLDVIQLARKEARAKGKRAASKKTPLAGDMQTLVDALPSLDQLKKRPTAAVPLQPKCLQKAKTRQKQALRDIASFQKVLNDPVYKSDPTSAISEYIQEKIRKELMDES